MSSAAVVIGALRVNSLWFPKQLDAIAEEEQELKALTESLVHTFKMEIRAEKTKTDDERSQ